MFLGFRRGDAPGKPLLAIGGDGRSPKLDLWEWCLGKLRGGGGRIEGSGNRAKAYSEAWRGNLPRDRRNRVPENDTSRENIPPLSKAL